MPAVKGDLYRSLFLFGFFVCLFVCLFFLIRQSFSVAFDAGGIRNAAPASRKTIEEKEHGRKRQNNNNNNNNKKRTEQSWVATVEFVSLSFCVASFVCLSLGRRGRFLFLFLFHLSLSVSLSHLGFAVLRNEMDGRCRGVEHSLAQVQRTSRRRQIALD